MTIMQHPTAERQQPTPHTHPLVAAILALAAEWDADMNRDRWETIAAGLVGPDRVEQLDHLAGVLAESERVLDGTAGYACFGRRDMADALRADAVMQAQLLASLTLADRRAS